MSGVLTFSRRAASLIEAVLSQMKMTTVNSETTANPDSIAARENQVSRAMNANLSRAEHTSVESRYVRTGDAKKGRDVQFFVQSTARDEMLLAAC